MTKGTFMLDPQGISKAVEFTETELKKFKGIKNIPSTLISVEEAMVMLMENGGGYGLDVYVYKNISGIYVKITAEGKEFDFKNDIDLGVDLLKDEYDSAAQDTIRAILLRAYGDSIKYQNKGGRSTVVFTVSKSEKALLYLTVAGLVLGILFGFILKLMPSDISAGINTFALTPIKTLFMNALKMLVAPVVFFSLVSCVSQFNDLRELGRTGGKVMGYYMFTTVIAIAVGFAVSFAVRPSAAGIAELVTSSGGQVSEIAETPSFIDTVVNIIPENIVEPFITGDMMQIIFIAIICGIAVGSIGSYSKALADFFGACNDLFLGITTMVVRFIPIATFCAIASSTMAMGGDSLLSMLGMTATVILGLLIMLVVYSVILSSRGINPLLFFKRISAGMITAFSTSSSNAAMPVNMQICGEELGIAPKIYTFSIPLGATVNMDGTSVCGVIMSMFFARAFGIEFTAAQLIAFAVTVLVLSISTPGIPGATIIVTSVMFASIGLPIECVALVFGVDSVIDMFRSAINATGDMAITAVVAKSERLMDMAVFNRKKK